MDEEPKFKHGWWILPTAIAALVLCTALALIVRLAW